MMVATSRAEQPASEGARLLLLAGQAAQASLPVSVSDITNRLSIWAIGLPPAARRLL